MSELLRIIDEYKDAHGQPSDSSVARAIGVVPQALSNWRRRGFKDLPRVETLRKLAELTGLPFEEYVVQAALVDIGARREMPDLNEARRRESA